MLFSRTEHYADNVRRLYAAATDELLKLSAMKAPNGMSAAFSFSDSKRLSEQANAILRALYSGVYNEIKGGVIAEWENANKSCDALITSIFGKKVKEDNHYARFFARNKESVDAFFKRKSEYGGLNLSQRVWKYVGDFKTEMEMALSVAMGEGKSAATISREVCKYLQRPDMMFRRFRVKTGEQDIFDADGNIVGKESVYGRVWKRKVVDAMTGNVSWQTVNLKDYSFGRGVYRSSYKNAMRLARTETNMAYRTADQERWKRLDFVIGYRVVLSDNHPEPDICNDLSAKRGEKGNRGVYPKDFVFKGWHPQCRCYVVPILADDKEFDKIQEAILNDEPIPENKSAIREPNRYFQDWWKSNKGRVAEAQSLPYWVKDNPKYARIKREKTDAEKQSIQKRWNERREKNEKIIKMASNVANVANDYPEVDLSKLNEYIATKNAFAANVEARKIAKQVSVIMQDEKSMSDLIPDVHSWKKQFTSKEMHAVYDAVEKKLAGWSSLPLEQQAKKLQFEAVDFLGGNMNGVQAKYKTWQVSQAAYLKKYAEVKVEIEINQCQFELNALAPYLKAHPKAVKFAQMVADAQAEITKGADLATIKSKVAAVQTEYQKRLAAEAKRNAKKQSTQFGADAYTDARKNNAVWDKGNGKLADDTLHDTAGNAWRAATNIEKDKTYEYTHHYCNINEPLQNRTYIGHQTKKEFLERVDNITSYIERNTLPCDMWFTRGDDGMGVIASRIKFAGGTMPSDPQDLVGMVMQEGGFMSTGSRKGQGFGGKSVILNIYAPKGVKAAYIEPISAYGNGAGRNWDGIQKFHTYSGEHETLFQRGTKMRITKVYTSNGQTFIDCEVIEQELKNLSYVKDSNIGY